MPSKFRHTTQYPGVYFIEGKTLDGKPERIYYIRYRRKGKSVDEKAGRQYRDAMTPARANMLRQRKINGDAPPNAEARKKTVITLNDMFTEFKANKNHLKRWNEYEWNYNRHIKSRFGSKPPGEITRRDIDRMRRKLSEDHSPQSVKHYIDLIPRIVNFCADRGLCQRFPYRIFHAKFDNKKTDDLSADQIAALMKALALVTDPQLVALVKLALFTGMRKSEILRLEWRDIDLDRGFIFIRDPKGVIGAHIPINTFAREVLIDIKHTASPYVLPSPFGGPRNRSAFMRQLVALRKAAGLPADFRPLHGLRHTYASMLASSGQIDMYTLQKLLTHKSPQMTQRYAHLRDEALKKAADVADSLFAPKKKPDE